MLRPLISSLVLLALGGCTPTCEETCRKLTDCGNLGTTGVTVTSCTDACELQEAQLAEWNDTQKLAALDEERRCLAESTCDEIEDGACYDPTIWSYDASAAE